MPKRIYLKGLPQERLWTRVKFNGPILVRSLGRCWLWLGAKNKWGYGHLRLSPRRGSFAQAHRFAFVLLCGPYPKWTEPHHRCENPGCIRPSHQLPVSHAVNMGFIRRNHVTRKSN